VVDVLHSVPVYLLLMNGGDIGAVVGVPTRGGGDAEGGTQ
jgi:hypothetical protein